MKDDWDLKIKEMNFMREEKFCLVVEFEKRYDENDNLCREVEELGRILEVKLKDFFEVENCVSKF